MSEIEYMIPADDRWGVFGVSSAGGPYLYRKTPCGTCPFRRDAKVGRFPPEAYIAAAAVSYDAAPKGFGCHSDGADDVHTCAGFIALHYVNNLAMRMKQIAGLIDVEQVLSNVEAAGIELYRDYRETAIANGVPADHPALQACRGNDD